MPSYFSYVGKLDSPDFFWNDIPDAKFRVGNTPHRILPADYGDLWFIARRSKILGEDRRI